MSFPQKRESSKKPWIPVYNKNNGENQKIAEASCLGCQARCLTYFPDSRLHGNDKKNGKENCHE